MSAVGIQPTSRSRTSLAGLPEFLGIRVVSAELTRVVGELDTTREHATGSGERVHGGAIMSFADTLGAVGTVLNLPAGCTTTTIESKTNFFAAGVLGTLTGTAEPLHIGRTTMVWQTTIANPDGRKVAIVTQTQLVMAPKAEAAAPARLLPQPPAGPEPRSTAEERRAQIFAAASAVISSKGYAQSTVRDIADAAGMPVPTMYQYIRGKEDILALIFKTYMAEIRAALEEARRTRGSARERVEAVIRANMACYDRYYRQIRLMYRETQMLSRDGRRQAIALTREVSSLMAEVIEEGIQSGELDARSSDLVANFIPMLCATWTLRYWNVAEHGLPAVTDAIVTLVLDGIGKPPDGAGSAPREAARRRKGAGP